MEYIKTIGYGTYDVHVFTNENSVFDKFDVYNCIDNRQIKFSKEITGDEDVLEDIADYRLADIGITKLKYLNIVTITRYG